jgi:hypothetical protein
VKQPPGLVRVCIFPQGIRRAFQSNFVKLEIDLPWDYQGIPRVGKTWYSNGTNFVKAHKPVQTVLYQGPSIFPVKMH